MPCFFNSWGCEIRRVFETNAIEAIDEKPGLRRSCVTCAVIRHGEATGEKESGIPAYRQAGPTLKIKSRVYARLQKNYRGACDTQKKIERGARSFFATPLSLFSWPLFLRAFSWPEFFSWVFHPTLHHLFSQQLFQIFLRQPILFLEP